MQRDKIFRNMVFLCFILVALVGCVPESVSSLFSGNDYARTPQHNFKQGTAELQVNLLKNSPPERIYPHSRFKIIAQLDNEAAYDITNGRLSVVGIDPQYFTVQPLDKAFSDLKGKSLVMPAGDRGFVEFLAQAGELPKQNAEREEHFIVRASYASQLDFADAVCINPNIYEVYDAGCQLESEKSYSGQGAPLAVEAMEEVISPGIGGEAEFRFLLRNKGDGEVKQVILEEARLGAAELSCEFKTKGDDTRTATPDSDTGEAVLICKFPLRTAKSYTTFLSLKFSYEYVLLVPYSMVLVN